MLGAQGHDVVEVVAEQARVDAEGHGGGGVTQHPLNGLDVRTGGMAKEAAVCRRS
jgi:hypothetical protein